MYQVLCFSHKGFSRYHHNQADDIVCTLIFELITSKSIGPFLQREVENMLRSL